MPDVMAEAEKPGLRTGLAERAEKLDLALMVVRSEIASDQFAKATGKFREAVNLSRSWPELRPRVIRVAVEQAKGLLPRNWRVAEALLTETRGLVSEYSAPSDLWDRVRAAQHDELIGNAISVVDVTAAIGSVEQAKLQLEAFLVAHPGDERLKARLRELVAPPPTETAIPPVEASGETELTEQETEEQTAEELEEDLDPIVTLGGQRLKIAVSLSAWDKFKTAMTLVATAGMLGAAVALVWMHYTHPPVRQKAARAAKIINSPAVVAPPVSLAGAEEKAWQIVESSRKPEDVQLFLSLFPTSPHASEARRMMSTAEAKDWQSLNHASSKALEAFLQAHPSGEHANAALNELAELRSKAPPK